MNIELFPQRLYFYWKWWFVHFLYFTWTLPHVKHELLFGALSMCVYCASVGDLTAPTAARTVGTVAQGPGLWIRPFSHSPVGMPFPSLSSWTWRWVQAGTMGHRSASFERETRQKKKTLKSEKRKEWGWSGKVRRKASNRGEMEEMWFPKMDDHLTSNQTVNFLSRGLMSGTYCQHISPIITHTHLLK